MHPRSDFTTIMALAYDLLGEFRVMDTSGDFLEFGQETINIYYGRYLHRNCTTAEMISIASRLGPIISEAPQLLTKDCFLFELAHWLWHEVHMASTSGDGAIPPPASTLN